MIADQLLDWHEDAHLSKLDTHAAFKLVPVKPTLVRFQGFTFLGKYFVETQLVFGGCSSPALYDRLHEVFTIVVMLRSGADPEQIHWTLDDFVCASPDRSTNE